MKSAAVAVANAAADAAPAAPVVVVAIPLTGDRVSVEPASRGDLLLASNIHCYNALYKKGDENKVDCEMLQLHRLM